MEVFVNGVIAGAGEGGPAKHSPLVGEGSGNEEGDLANRDQDRTVPPSHWNGVFIFLMGEMVGNVGLENAVVNQGMPDVRVAKPSHRLVHDEPM